VLLLLLLTVKILDAKRSQQLGIIMSSKRLDYHKVHEAIFQFDTELFSSETMNAIYTIRPTVDEITAIEVKTIDH